MLCSKLETDALQHLDETAGSVYKSGHRACRGRLAQPSMYLSRRLWQGFGVFVVTCYVLWMPAGPGL